MLDNLVKTMQPGMPMGHGYEVVAMKKGCCDQTFESDKIQNVLNQQAAAGRELVWIWHEDQATCCSTDDRLMLVFKVRR